jgi:hypothetical protein
MIDYQLKNQMEQAFLEGRQDDALKLSQELDVQIVQATKAMMEDLPSISCICIERGRYT